MILRQCSCRRMWRLHLTSLLSLWLIYGQVVAQASQTPATNQLRITEHVATMQRHEDLWRHQDTKRSSEECGQERLDSVLRSCEAAASSSLSAPPPTMTMNRDDPTADPLVFCGADCSHLVITYVSECGRNEFLVNVSGACKLSGQNLTVECVYAVVLVKMGITSCIKMVVDVDAMHEIDGIAPTVPDSREYIDEQCCSLETSYESVVIHEVRADTMGRPVIEPPLEPPWLQANASDVQAVLDVISSELCLVPLPTEPATTTELIPSTTSEEEPSTNSTSSGFSGTVNSADSLLTSLRHRPPILACFLLSITLLFPL